MKKLLALILTIPMFSIADTKSEKFYEAVKYMIHESTQARVNAFADGDYTKVCRATQSSAKHDTMAYYLSFEVFDNNNISSRLYKDLSPFYTRNLESIYRNRLPIALHNACWAGNKAEISKVMRQIIGILSLE
jgi:hypothetical protein